jgi:arylsulfatase A-like enzyme
MLPANFEIPPYEPEIIRTATMANRRIYPDDRYTPDQWRRYRWAYYRLTELADRQIGLVLDALDARGLLQDSVIVFMSDHGDGHGAHRLVQKTFLYEESTRVPFIVAAPDITKKGKVDNESLISSCLDGFATICDYAGVDLPEGVTRPDGPISLRQAVSGTAAPVSRRYIAAETELQQAAYSGRMIRTNRYKYCAWQWGAYREQLFDLERDPGEMVNLAVSTSHRQILQDHRDLLREWCEVTADQFYGHHYSHPAVPFMVPGDSYPQEA